MSRPEASENKPKPITQPRNGNTFTRRHATGQEAPVSASEPAGRQYVPPPVDRSRIVQRPVPRAQADEPREFQIQQLRRRFSPLEKTEADATTFSFTIVPTDPDFPFEMEGLECVLHVPSSYPRGRKPHIDVKNQESRSSQISHRCFGTKQTPSSIKHIKEGSYSKDTHSIVLP